MARVGPRLALLDAQQAITNQEVTTMRLGPHEQPEALRSLRTLARPHRLRVTLDPERWPIIPGRLGQIEYHDGIELAVYSDRPRLFSKLWAIPGVRRHQTGDQEMRALFPPEALEQVAGVIRARKRRRPNSGSFPTPGIR
jgi:hypothetical protein